MSDGSRDWLQSYDRQVAAEIDLPAITLREVARQTAERFPDRVAFHFFDVSWTFRQLMQQGDRFACALSRHGLGPGDVLAIHLLNSPQYLIALYGAFKAGVVVSGLSPLLMPDELAYQLSDLGAKAVITLDNLYADRLAAVVPEIKTLKLIVLTGLWDYAPAQKGDQEASVPTGPGLIGLSELLSQHPPQAPEITISPQDPCFIQYTGGTTGVPKGAVLTHANVIANQLQMAAWLGLDKSPQTFLFAFPMFHIAGLVHAVQSLMYGLSQVIIANPRDLAHLMAQMERHRPTMMANVPTLLLQLLKEPAFARIDFSRLKFCLCGAAPFPASKVAELEKVLGQSKLIEVYGLTEASGLLIANPRGGLKKAGAIGLPLPSTRLKLVDLAGGEKEVPLGQEGEIVARGPQIMRGYFNKPAEDRVALRQHGGELWFHTGDVARTDPQGYFFLVDRAKDMINVGGYKVFSSEVEHKLGKHPAIAMCAIVGLPNPERPGSELVKLYVERSAACAQSDEDSLRQEIVAFARQKLAPYKVPKVVEFLDAMPLTSVGKVNKKALRQKS